jgi:hypothetical protein
MLFEKNLKKYFWNIFITKLNTFSIKLIDFYFLKLFLCVKILEYI